MHLQNSFPYVSGGVWCCSSPSTPAGRKITTSLHRFSHNACLWALIFHSNNTLWRHIDPSGFICRYKENVWSEYDSLIFSGFVILQTLHLWINNNNSCNQVALCSGSANCMKYALCDWLTEFIEVTLSSESSFFITASSITKIVYA